MFDLVVIKGPDVKKWAIWSRQEQRFQFRGRQWNTKEAAQAYLNKFLWKEQEYWDKQPSQIGRPKRYV